MRVQAQASAVAVAACANRTASSCAGLSSRATEGYAQCELVEGACQPKESPAAAAMPRVYPIRRGEAYFEELPVGALVTERVMATTQVSTYRKRAHSDC